TVPPPRGRVRDHAGAAPPFVPFRINWGERQGADPRRLLALVCRRGNIRGGDVGAIRIGITQSTFEVAAAVAAGFARAVKKPDARDPRIRIEATAPTAPAPAPPSRHRPPPAEQPLPPRGNH